MAETLIDTYNESNWNTGDTVYSAYPMHYQSFTGKYILTSCKFYFKKVGSPTGSMTARLYAHSGTFGTSSIPTGPALAESGSIDVSTLSGTTKALITFNFTGANRYKMVDGTKYCIVIYYDGGNSSNYVEFAIDTSSPTHGGNRGWYTQSTSTWTAESGGDGIFMSMEYLSLIHI